MAVFSQRSKDSLKGVHPDLVKVMSESIKNSPVDFTIVDGVRTLERQKQLYSQGRTTKGIIVTNADGVKKKSNHQVKSDGFGHAVDIYPFYNGSVQVRDKQVVPKLKLITSHIKRVAQELNIGITCGIDWKNPYDPPHIELKTIWREIN